MTYMQNEKKNYKDLPLVKAKQKISTTKKLLSNPLVRKMTYQMAFVCI